MAANADALTQLAESVKTTRAAKTADINEIKNQRSQLLAWQNAIGATLTNTNKLFNGTGIYFGSANSVEENEEFIGLRYVVVGLAKPITVLFVVKHVGKLDVFTYNGRTISVDMTFIYPEQEIRDALAAIIKEYL